jgi:hypothetical protein
MSDCILPVSQIDYRCLYSHHTQMSHTDQMYHCKSIEQVWLCMVPFRVPGSTLPQDQHTQSQEDMEWSHTEPGLVYRAGRPGNRRCQDHMMVHRMQFRYRDRPCRGSWIDSQLMCKDHLYSVCKSVCVYMYINVSE